MKILIAGASGGIGKYLAERLSSKYAVFGTYRNRVPDEEHPYRMSKADVRFEHDVKVWLNSVTTAEDEIALIYCVGINYNSMIHKSDSEKWKEVIESNLLGLQRILKQILPIMRNRKYGRIILLSSVVPQIGVPGTSAYAASKAALWGLSKAVAKENAQLGITINTINLGYFDIGMIQEVPSEMLDSTIKNIPMQKLGDPINILKAVEFLIDADYITGSCIDLNGGLF